MSVVHQTRLDGRWTAFIPMLAATLMCAGSVAASEQDHAVAVWKAQEVDFFYRSSQAIYGCGALKARVVSLFRALGARDGVEVRLDDCREFISPHEQIPDPWQSHTTRAFNDRTSIPEQRTHVRVRVMLPVEVTPQVLDEIDRDKSRRELISRVTGNPAAALNDPVAFPAERQTVTLSRRSVGLEPIECELLDQMSQVFRKLDMRVVSRNYACSRNSVSRIPPELTVEALMAVAAGTKLPEIEPAETETETPADPPQHISPAS